MKEKFTILITDRNRNIWDFLQREMIAEGYLVHTAKNGREVLKLVDFENPDILILDLDMPYLDGLEILKHFNIKTGLFLWFLTHSIKRMKIKFIYAVRKIRLTCLNRHSRIKSFNWAEFRELWKRYPLPEPRIRKTYMWIHSAS